MTANLFEPSFATRFAALRTANDVPIVSFADWKDRYWKSTPGPFYGTDSTLVFGVFDKPARPFLIAFDDRTEFLWRQPRDASEFATLVDAMNNDPLASFGADGNSHWTRPLLREWKRRVPEILAWAEAQLRIPEAEFHEEARSRLTTYRTVLRQMCDYYRGSDLDEYLCVYAFMLEEGRQPRRGESVPRI